MKYIKFLFDFILRYISPRGRVERIEFTTSIIVFILLIYQLLQGLEGSEVEAALAGLGIFIAVILLSFQIKKRIADLPKGKKSNPLNWFFGKSEIGDNKNGSEPSTFWKKLI